MDFVCTDDFHKALHSLGVLMKSPEWQVRKNRYIRKLEEEKACRETDKEFAKKCRDEFEEIKACIFPKPASARILASLNE